METMINSKDLLELFKYYDGKFDRIGDKVNSRIDVLQYEIVSLLGAGFNSYYC